MYCLAELKSKNLVLEIYTVPKIVCIPAKKNRACRRWSRGIGIQYVSGCLGLMYVNINQTETVASAPVVTVSFSCEDSDYFGDKMNSVC